MSPREELIHELLERAEKMTAEERREFFREAMLRIRDLDLYTLELYASSLGAKQNGR